MDKFATLCSENILMDILDVFKRGQNHFIQSHVFTDM